MRPLWLVIAVIFALVAGFAVMPFVEEFLAVDECLDAGGSFNYLRGSCDFAMSHPFLPYSQRYSANILAVCVEVGISAVALWIGLRRTDWSRLAMRKPSIRVLVLYCRAIALLVPTGVVMVMLAIETLLDPHWITALRDVVTVLVLEGVLALLFLLGLVFLADATASAERWPPSMEL